MKLGTRQKAIGNSKKAKVIRVALCAMLFALCASVDAQQKKMTHICHLTTSPDVLGRKAFIQRLRELGHIDGQNLTSHYAEGKIERLPELVAELLDLNAR